MFNYMFNGTRYTIAAVNDHVLAVKRGKEFTHFFKITADNDYVYKIQKTQVKAAGGAHGLEKHFKECADNNFAVHAWFISVVDSIIENVKECRDEIPDAAHIAILRKAKETL